MSLSEASIGRTLMQRKLIIAFVVLAVAVLPLTATCVVAADGAQQTAHTCGHRTLPFAGIFSGTYVAVAGGTTYTGTGVFTHYGWSRVEAHQTTGTLNPQPFYMTITFAKGDTISLHVPPGSRTYQIDGGTGRFASVIGGSGYFSLSRSVHGTHETFIGHLSGTIILA